MFEQLTSQHGLNQDMHKNPAQNILHIFNSVLCKKYHILGTKQISVNLKSVKSHEASFKPQRYGNCSLVTGKKTEKKPQTSEGEKSATEQPMGQQAHQRGKPRKSEN